MAIKFEYDGIKFEVSTPREAAQVVRELRRVNRGPLALGFGEGWEHAAAARERADTPLALRESFIASIDAERKALEGAIKKMEAEAVSMAKELGGDRMLVTRAFLNAIRRTPGMDAHQIGKVLNAKHLKGLGPRTMLVHNVLRELGFEPDQVYSSDRTAQGRRWVPREKLGDALAAVEQRTSAIQKELLPQN